jgi:gas vesicle protein
MLFAPKSGAETRQAIRRRGKKIRNGASDAWEDLRLELAATKRALRRKRRDQAMEEAPEE